MSKNRAIRITLVVAPVAVLVLIGIWLLIDDNQVDLRDLDDAAFREHVNEVAGVQQVIDFYRRDRHATFRTNDDKQVFDEEEYQWLQNDATEEERHRWYFALAIQLQIGQAQNSLPPELGEGGILQASYFEAMQECAVDHGHRGLLLSSPPPDEYERLQSVEGISFDGTYYDRLESDFGITLDEYFDIRHDCAMRAQHYPNLDEAERDRLLKQRNDYYWREIKDFLLKDPDIIIPRLEPSECTAAFIAECVGEVP